MVSLLIGVNNQYRGESLDRYEREFKVLLATATKFAGDNAKHVFVLSIPDWGVTPHGSSYDRTKVAREIDDFNAAAKEICREQGIAFIDITPQSRLALKDPAMIAGDQLHFSGKMYQAWAELALPQVSAMLK